MTVIKVLSDADGNLRCPWHDHLLTTEDGVNYECPENAPIQRAIERDLARVMSARCACWQGDEMPSPAHSPLCSLHSGCGKP